MFGKSIHQLCRCLLPIHLSSNIQSHKHMEVTKTPRTDPATFNEAEFDRNFKPKGAIAFFVLLVILGLIIWYGIYFLMLARA